MHRVDVRSMCCNRYMYVWYGFRCSWYKYDSGAKCSKSMYGQCVVYRICKDGQLVDREISHTN